MAAPRSNNRSGRPYDRRGPRQPQVKRRSYFAAIQSTHIDYKDLNTIGRFQTQFARIQPRRYTGHTVRHQKMLSQAIKRARFMGLLPYTMEHRSHKAD